MDVWSVEVLEFLPVGVGGEQFGYEKQIRALSAKSSWCRFTQDNRAVGLFNRSDHLVELGVKSFHLQQIATSRHTNLLWFHFGYGAH